jgi:predicted kinase
VAEADEVLGAEVRLTDAVDGLLVVTGASGVGKSSVSHAVAATLERSVHLRVDDFLFSVVGGWIDPWLPAAAQQNDAVGRAAIAAAMQFVAAGYTVVVDGTIFPDAIDELAPACREHEVPLHLVVLRCPVDVARERALDRAHDRTAADPQPESAAILHTRFEELGSYERYAIDASGPPAVVATAVVTAFTSGALQV